MKTKPDLKRAYCGACARRMRREQLFYCEGCDAVLCAALARSLKPRRAPAASLDARSARLRVRRGECDSCARFRAASELVLFGLPEDARGPDEVFVGDPSVWSKGWQCDRGVQSALDPARYVEDLCENAETRLAIPTLAGKILRCNCTCSPCHAVALAAVANPRDAPPPKSCKGRA